MKKLILVPVLALLAASIAANSMLLIQQNGKFGEISTGIGSLETNLSAVRGDISVLQGNISSLQSGYTNLQGGISALQGNVSYLQGSYTIIQGSYATLQNNYASLQGNYLNLLGNLTTLQGSYTNLQGNLVNLQNSYTGLQTSVSTVQGNISGLQGKLTDLGGQITTIQTGLTKANADLAKIQADAAQTLSQADLVKLVEPVVVLIETSFGSGTGIILSNNGYVLTANHVVDNVTTCTVTLSNGERFGSNVVARDSDRDIAIVKMNTGRTDFSAAVLGSSDNTSVGESVMTSGYALGLEGKSTYTMGIVSAFRVEEGSNYIQTDAPINSGNSGGPMFNMKGQVIGVNVGKFVGRNVEAMGLAVPIDECKALIQSTVK